MLSDNHRRAVSASMYLIEKIVGELENELLGSGEKVMTKIPGTSDMKHYEVIVKEIKSYICYMHDKYDLRPFSFSLSQVVNSRKSKMWEVLCDTKSEKLNNRGKFPSEYAKEFDADIDKLLKLTESL